MAHARAGKKYTINTAAGWRRLTSDGRGARSVGRECQCAGARGARVQTFRGARRRRRKGAEQCRSDSLGLGLPFPFNVHIRRQSYTTHTVAPSCSPGTSPPAARSAGC